MTGRQLNQGRPGRRAARAAGVAAAAFGLLALNALSAQSAAPVARASAYVNSDNGKNADVKSPSDCATPDRTDVQVIGPGSTNNVHVDACLFSANALPSSDTSDIDTSVTWDSRGVGGFFACPDPDNLPNVPPNPNKTSTLHAQGSLGHASSSHCHQSGFQSKGIDGDGEYHARVNSSRAGQQRVTFCADADQDGCADEPAGSKSQVVIGWVRR